MLAQLRRPAEGMPGEYEILAPQTGRILRRGVRPGQAMEAMAPAFLVAGGTGLDIVFTAPIGLHGELRPGLGVRLPDGGMATVVAVGADTDALSQGLRVIRSGIKPDDRVIVNGGVRLMGPNMKVKAKVVTIEPKKAAAQATSTVTIPVASSATPVGAR